MLEVRDSQAGALFEKLERFLGSGDIDRRLKKIARELEIERGTYRDCWALPHRQWWLGLEEARQLRKAGRSFRGQLTKRMKAPLETAANVNLLYGGMPATKRDEYKRRILSADNLNPVLMEISVASHFVQNGCKLMWSSDDAGGRIPEFLASKGSDKWEVECKTRGYDAGRRVTRSAFYRLVDALGPRICDLGWQGGCKITVPDRMPIQNAWRTEIVENVLRMIRDGRNEYLLPSGERIDLSLHRRNSTALDQAEFERVKATKAPDHHIALFGRVQNGQYVDPVRIDVGSEKPDAYLDDVLEDLRQARRQFSGQHPGVICCFIPEIESFAGLETSSGIRNMTGYFFEKHAPPFVHSVVYLSDAVEEGYFPALRFQNRRSDTSIPANLLIGRLSDPRHQAS